MDYQSDLLNSFKSIISIYNIAWLVAIWIVYQVLITLYNISPLHPLYHFPGPKLAAATYLYEGYYDGWLVGRYGKLIARMHEQYGPIVRINPDELHCSDPAFTDEIYSGPSRVRNKWQHQVNTNSAGPISVTTLSTVPHELHRARRAPLAKFFSRQQVFKLEDEVYEFARATVHKMLTEAGKGEFDVKEAFSCFTADVISQYAFGEPMGFIAQEGWEPNFTSWVKPVIQSAYKLRYNALSRKIAEIAPLAADFRGGDIQTIMRLMTVTIPEYIRTALKNPEKGRVFVDIMSDTGLLSEEEKYRYSGEGFVFLLAGTETTASTIAVLAYWLFAKPHIYQRLVSDFSSAGITAENLKLVKLEKLPYFWASVQEALRMMPGVSHRSARIAPEEELHYRSADGRAEWVIPRGTPIGMTSMINHWNTELFPNPDEFAPERWLLPDGQPNYPLEKKLISFGKGTRSCIGENLARCEIYIMVALMILCVIPRAKLVDTTAEDIYYDHDLVVPQTKKGSISIRIAID